MVVTQWFWLAEQNAVLLIHFPNEFRAVEFAVVEAKLSVVGYAQQTLVAEGELLWLLEAHNAVVMEHLSALEPCLHRCLLHATLCLDDIGLAVLNDDNTAMRVARERTEFDSSTLVGLGDMEDNISMLGLVGSIADHEIGCAHYEKGCNGQKRVL